MEEKIKNNQIILIKAAVVNQQTINDINIINEISQHINNYRDKHGVPRLMWDNTIANFSQKWSNYLLANNMFAHSGSQLYGENLAYFRGYGVDLLTLVKLAIDLWYEEIKLYDFNNPGFTEATGHATCLLWKNSTKFGIGFSFNRTKQIVDVVFNSSPPGNINGQFKENVLPLIHDPVIQNPCPPCPTLTTTTKLPKAIITRAYLLPPYRNKSKSKSKNIRSKSKHWDWDDYDCDYPWCDDDSDSCDDDCWDDWSYDDWYHHDHWDHHYHHDWDHHYDWDHHHYDWDYYDDYDYYWRGKNRNAKLRSKNRVINEKNEKPRKFINPKRAIKRELNVNTNNSDKLNIVKSLHNILNNVTTNQKRVSVENAIKDLINRIGDLD